MWTKRRRRRGRGHPAFPLAPSRSLPSACTHARHPVAADRPAPPGFVWATLTRRPDWPFSGRLVLGLPPATSADSVFRLLPNGVRRVHMSQGSSSVHSWTDTWPFPAATAVRGPRRERLRRAQTAFPGGAAPGSRWRGPGSGAAASRPRRPADVT